MSGIIEALIEACNAITTANAFPPNSIGLTPGQMQQLRDELRESANRPIEMGRSPNGEIYLALPAGPLRC